MNSPVFFSFHTAVEGRVWSFHIKKPRMDLTFLAVLAAPKRWGDKHHLSLGGPRFSKLGVLFCDTVRPRSQTRGWPRVMLCLLTVFVTEDVSPEGEARPLGPKPSGLVAQSRIFSWLGDLRAIALQHLVFARFAPLL